MYRIRFHGRGGQGIKTASRILGSAFFAEGFEVQDAPRYGAERRGAPITVRLVKGAYWDYEIIRADQMGWPIPVYRSKAMTDVSASPDTATMPPSTTSSEAAPAPTRSAVTAVAITDSSARLTRKVSNSGNEHGEKKAANPVAAANSNKAEPEFRPVRAKATKPT